VIAFTSCVPGEGTTTSALGLAHTAAADGQRTLLLDLDLHRCAVVKALNLQLAGSSLDRYLRSECEVSELVHKVPNFIGLEIIGSSHPPRAPGNLLNSHRFRELFEAVRQYYDVIIVDTPPILSVDDVNWLSPLLDAVILVVSCGETKEETLAKGAARLRMTQAPLLGTVLNKVMTRRKRSSGGAARLRMIQAPLLGTVLNKVITRRKRSSG
jgi:capsular exopolysaccharide synthesis family protein